MKCGLAIVLACLLSAPAIAQIDHSAMPGMKTPPKATSKAKPDAVKKLPEEPQSTEPPPADPHAGHDMSAVADAATPADEEVGTVPAPTPPTDHAADAVYGADEMAVARKVLAYEVGGMGYSLTTIDLLEIGTQNGKESYKFEAKLSLAKISAGLE